MNYYIQTSYLCMCFFHPGYKQQRGVHNTQPAPSETGQRDASEQRGGSTPVLGRPAFYNRRGYRGRNRRGCRFSTRDACSR